jgi:hypothetical protein
VITPEGSYDYPRRKTMTNLTHGRWLLVALAIVGLALAVPLVGAHGTDTTAHDEAPYDGTADHSADWMDGHATDHMDPGSVDWMTSHAGVPVDGMAHDDHDVAHDDHDAVHADHDGVNADHDAAHDDHDGRTGSQSHC